MKRLRDLKPKKDLGYCKECMRLIDTSHEIPGHPGIYECPDCGHPQTENEMWWDEEIDGREHWND